MKLWRKWRLEAIALSCILAFWAGLWVVLTLGAPAKAVKNACNRLESEGRNSYRVYARAAPSLASALELAARVADAKFEVTIRELAVDRAGYSTTLSELDFVYDDKEDIEYIRADAGDWVALREDAGKGTLYPAPFTGLRLTNRCPARILSVRDEGRDDLSYTEARRYTFKSEDPTADWTMWIYEESQSIARLESLSWYAGEESPYPVHYRVMPFSGNAILTPPELEELERR